MKEWGTVYGTVVSCRVIMEIWRVGFSFTRAHHIVAWGISPRYVYGKNFTGWKLGKGRMSKGYIEQGDGEN
ncbi:Uncharacterized protein APZ42_025426, partial [Daphnia magna]